MSNNYRRLSVAAMLVAVFCLLSSAAFAQRGVKRDFKNLGGPAEEISAMRLPDPSTLGTRSKSAMFPIVPTDSVQEMEIPVDSNANFRLMLLSPNGRALTLRAALPGDGFIDLRSDAFARRVSRTETTYGLEGNQFPAEVFSFEAVKTGRIRVQIEFPKELLGGDEPIGYLVASSDSPDRLYSYVDTLQTTVGRSVGIVSMMFDEKSNADDGLPTPGGNAIRDAGITIRTPDGKVLEFPMIETEPGVVRAGFVPTAPGRYTAQVFVKGRTAADADFVRSSELTFDVAETNIRFGNASRSARLDDLRYELNLPIIGAKSGDRVITHAEIWGRDADGNEFPVSWLGGMTIIAGSAKRGLSLPLILDTRWLAQAPNAKSFFLRSVRVQNPDGAILLGDAERIEIPGVFATDLAKSFAGIVNDEMRQGVRPPRTVDTAVGGKLMLVHGYCSGDAWGSAASAGQFSNYVKFLDLNKNRTHDQFANLIKNFGASLPSFGIVAHSQGGAASLHLYTYYWSGLDYATGSRLIQSVGTPYRGTALAGNLAILGQIFGAGCGSNYDLTYNGAAAWLAGIPNSARAKVYYHTTAFSDVWWRYDYCNIATDPFLSDPDDGVVERTYAQLTGGVNLGHKTGWCHTSGMRDPSQTTDSSRNSNMNANAAR